MYHELKAFRDGLRTDDLGGVPVGVMGETGHDPVGVLNAWQRRLGQIKSGEQAG